jgi:ubiquinone/menaquinone biosynthesis C-methylase UbiE
MIAVARALAPDIHWQQANALELPFASASFDLVLCQQALQFFPDRAAGVREMRRVLSNGGRTALSTWRPLAENPVYLALHELAESRFGPNLDRRFSFGDSDALRSLLVDAGFRDIDIETVTLRDRMSDPDTFIAMNLSATVDLSTIDEPNRRQVIADFQAEARKRIAPYFEGAALVHPVSANVVTAAV